MAENIQKGLPNMSRSFEPEIDSEVVECTRISIDFREYWGESAYIISQKTGKIVVKKSKLKEFALELLDVAETYSGNWNAQMFRK